MVVKVPQIQTTNWSPHLGEFGEIVENIEDLNQCIEIILTTPAGSDPHRPEFANRLEDFLDQPVTIVKPFLIERTFDALLRWEPRINVDNVEVSTSTSELGRVDITIFWSIPDSVIETFTTVTV